MWKETCFLKHIAERPLVRRQKGTTTVLPHVAVDLANAVAHAQEPGDAAQDRRLAAAGRAEKRGHAFRRRREACVERKLADRAPVSTKSKMAVDMTRVRPGMLPPIIKTTPNSPTVWANPSTAPLRSPGLASGRATVQKARAGEARKVAATSSGRSPTAAKALRIGCTTNGIEARIEAMTRPVKVKARVRGAPKTGDRAAGPIRSERHQKIEAEHGRRQDDRKRDDRRNDLLPPGVGPGEPPGERRCDHKRQQRRNRRELDGQLKNRRPDVGREVRHLGSLKSVAEFLDNGARLRSLQEFEESLRRFVIGALLQQHSVLPDRRI